MLRNDVSEQERRRRLHLLSKALRTFHLADDTGLSELFFYATRPTKARIAKHLRSNSVVLPPGVSPEFVAEHLLSVFVVGADTQGLPHSEMKILFLASNPTCTSHLDLEEELRSLERELRGVKLRESIRLVAQHAARPDDLIRNVRLHTPNVIHFSGHGSHSGIELRDDSGGTRAVEGKHLQQFFRGRGIDLVFLNSCYSRSQVDAIKGVVRAVVGTDDSVEDLAALRFTTAFYRSLGDGFTIREAFRDAKDSVVLHGHQDVYHADGDLGLVLVT